MVSKQNLLVSVIVCSFNEALFLKKCIKSILNQSYKQFELIIIDDGSTDNSKKIIKDFKNDKMKLYQNKKNKGITFSRNLGLSLAKGKIIFFTDADCICDKYWIKNSLKYFDDKSVAVVEGKILPLTPNYITRLSDKIPLNNCGGKFSTGNIAYSSYYLDKAGRKIDLTYEGFEDRELGLRVSQYGKIVFAQDSIVYHQFKRHTFMSFINLAKRIPAKIRLIKKYNDQFEVNFHILHLKYLLVLIFPFLILIPVFKNRIRSFYDVAFIPLIYIKALYLRYLIWKTAIQERVFVL